MESSIFSRFCRDYGMIALFLCFYSLIPGSPLKFVSVLLLLSSKT